MDENTELNVVKTYTNPVTGKFVKGNPGGGRKQGSKPFAVLYREALKKIAEANGTTAEELEYEIHAMAIARARKGDFAFYRDIMDRVHGKPVQPTDLTTGGRPLFTVPNEIAQKNAIKVTTDVNDDTDTKAIGDSEGPDALPSGERG